MQADTEREVRQRMSGNTQSARSRCRPLSRFPAARLPFNLFKNEVCFQVSNDIFAGITYPSISFLSEVKTIVDIGANIGAASIYFAMAYPEAQVYAFEPGSAPLSLLQQNVALISQRQGLPFGLHSRERTLSLFQGRNDSVESSLCSSTRTTGESEKIRLAAHPSFLRSKVSRKSMC